ncbi:MAG: hypothetical protein AAF732_01045 [Pseudomonadota bacterium]
MTQRLQIRTRLSVIAVVSLVVASLAVGRPTLATEHHGSSAAKPSDQPSKPTAGPAQSSKTRPGQPQPSPKSSPGQSSASGSKMTMATFLDRLMMAESGGRDNARNPRSSASGPYQFIESTFLSLVRRHFPEKVAELSRQAQLALRFDRAFSRKVAEIYTRENASVLASRGHKPTFPNLRLAYLLGAEGASRILALDPKTPIAPVLGRRVIIANPFMARLTAGDLIARAARDIQTDPASSAGVKPGRLGAAKVARGPRIRVRCNLRLASCKRWLALKKRQLARRGKLTGRARLNVRCGPGVRCGASARKSKPRVADRRARRRRR